MNYYERFTFHWFEQFRGACSANYSAFMSCFCLDSHIQEIWIFNKQNKFSFLFSALALLQHSTAHPTPISPMVVHYRQKLCFQQFRVCTSWIKVYECSHRFPWFLGSINSIRTLPSIKLWPLSFISLPNCVYSNKFESDNGSLNWLIGQNNNGLCCPPYFLIVLLNKICSTHSFYELFWETVAHKIYNILVLYIAICCLFSHSWWKIFTKVVKCVCVRVSNNLSALSVAQALN